MITRKLLPFHNYLKKTLIETFTAEKYSPVEITKLLSNIRKRPCTSENSKAIKEKVIEQKIPHLVHFTRLDNVKSILTYGIMPRSHLELKVVNMVVNPIFSDKNRFDQAKENSCFSITFPNYKMLYKKRKESKKEWVILLINPCIMEEINFNFFKTNAARSGADNLQLGAFGLDAMFTKPELRSYLKLSSQETTDPQAEAMEDSIIEPKYIISVNVENQKAQLALTEQGITSTLNPQLFKPRHDSDFWKGRTILDLL